MVVVGVYYLCAEGEVSDTDGKRRHPRKIAAWPAWVRFHRSARYIKARTRDVSRGGMYITLPLETDVDREEPVEYILGVPSREGDNYAIQAVNGEAQVMRVERGETGGLALKFATEKDVF